MYITMNQKPVFETNRWAKPSVLLLDATQQPKREIKQSEKKEKGANACDTQPEGGVKKTGRSASNWKRGEAD